MLFVNVKDNSRMPGYADYNPFNAYIDTNSEETCIINKPLSWWIEKYELPLHIIYAPVIRRNIEAFNKVFREYYPGGGIRYAAKACCHPSVFRIMKNAGVGVDASSYNELACALESGIPPQDINLNGNCKEDFLIETAIEKNILFVADSLEEFEIISLAAAKLKRSASVIIRISGFDIDNITDECIFTAGVWTKFGIDIKKIPALIKNLDNYPWIDLTGFHMHIGSQVTEKTPFLSALGQLIETGHLLNRSGRKCRIINIGGGFPLSYVNERHWDNIKEKIKNGILTAESGDFSRLFIWKNETGGFKHNSAGTIDFATWHGEKFYTPYPQEKMLEEILKGNVKVHGEYTNTVKALKELGEPELLIEPGRSIIGNAGITLVKVNHVKKIAYTHDLIVLEMGVVNYSGSVIHKIINQWAVINDFSKKDAEPFEAFVCGNLCYNGDIIAKYKITLQRKPQRGDILILYDTGATEPHFFAANSNSYPRPARVMADENGVIDVLKKRDTYNDIF